MATGFNLGGFQDLSALEAASLQPAPSVNPLEALIGGFQQGAAIRNLPQTMANKALEQQLATAVARAKLAQLQQGAVEQVGSSLIRFNPATQKVDVLYTDPRVSAANRLQSMGLTQPNAQGVVSGVNFDPVKGEYSLSPLPTGVTSILPKTQSASGAKGGITESRLLTDTQRAARFGVDPIEIQEKIKTPEGRLDLAIEVGRREKSALKETNQAKLESLPAAVKEKAKEYQVAQESLLKFRGYLDDLQTEGKVPEDWDLALSASLNSDPNSFFSGLWNQGVQKLQSPEAAQVNRLRAELSSTIKFAQGGKSLTGTEKAEFAPFVPGTADSFQTLLDKAQGLEGFLNRKISGLTGPIPGASPAQMAPTPAVSPAAVAPRSAPRIIKITPRSAPR